MIPVPGRSVGTPYGSRGPYWSCFPDAAGNGVHTGVDYPAAVGARVVAARPGTVVYTDHGSDFGSHQLEILPGDGTRDFYAHMSARTVSDGQVVEAGEQIGQVGAEGNATGSHLHFERHSVATGGWSCGIVVNPHPSIVWPADAVETTALPILVSTRVEIGAESYFTYTGPGTFTLTAPEITPGSFSMVEANVSTNGDVRYWQYNPTADGAVRIDALLSMPGPNAHMASTVRLYAYHFDNLVDGDTGVSFDLGTVPIHLDGEAATVTFLDYGARQHGSIAVEAGETYIFQIQPVRLSGAHVLWGPCLRMSSFRAAEPTFYQLPDRTVTTWMQDGDGDGTDWGNDTPLAAWDETLSRRTSPGRQTDGGGTFTWRQSFGGVDPIYGISAELAIKQAWIHAIGGNGGFSLTDFYAAPDFDGTQQGQPDGDPPYHDPYWTLASGFKVYNDWSRSESSIAGVGFTWIVTSTMKSRTLSEGISLTWERYEVGPMVGYTPAEMAAWAGVDLADVVGFVYEDDLPEITALQVTADWNGLPAGGTDPTWELNETESVEWWAGPARFYPDLRMEAGGAFPAPTVPFGPAWGVVDAVEAIPVFSYVDSAGWSEGGVQRRPYDYLVDTGSVLIGTYSAGDGNPVYDVPEAIWQQALEVEAAWAEEDTSLDNLGGIEANHDIWTPIGLCFIAGLSEQLAETPYGPGLPAPPAGGSSDNLITTQQIKGLDRVALWPKTTYRPSRFQVVLAPDIEPPLLRPTGGPPTLRQHFEPIPPD